MKVLVVDDDARVRDALEIGIGLQWADAQVLTADNGEAGLDVFFNEEPDVVLLDVTMPRMNGFEVLKSIRQVSDVPVIMLAIHFQNHEVTVAGESVKLTPVEYKLLYHLVRNAGHLLPHQALLDRVWGSDYDASPEYLKVFISRLRSKLRRSDGPEYIETERGRGYRFVRPRPIAASPAVEAVS